LYGTAGKVEQGKSGYGAVAWSLARQAR